jgi:hypothetical protein
MSGLTWAREGPLPPAVGTVGTTGTPLAPPVSIRLRLPDLTMPWQQAIDTVLAAVERVRPRAVADGIEAGGRATG